MSSTNDSRETPSAESPSTRRGFFEIASVVLGGILGLVPVILGLIVFADPLSRKRKVPLAYRTQGGGKEGYLRVGASDALAVDGPPQRFQVIDDKIDSWNFIPAQPIGAIFMQRTKDGLRVFNTTCPHLGCSVSCDGNIFHCPCHNSSFELDGQKRSSDSGRENPSPRDLDKLEFEEIDGEIWVKYQNFYTSKSEQIPKT